MAGTGADSAAVPVCAGEPVSGFATGANSGACALGGDFTAGSGVRTGSVGVCAGLSDGCFGGATVCGSVVACGERVLTMGGVGAGSGTSTTLTSNGCCSTRSRAGPGSRLRPSTTRKIPHANAPSAAAIVSLTFRLSHASMRSRESLLTMNCNKKMFRAGASGRQHCPHDNAVPRCIIGGDNDVMIWVQCAPHGRLHLIEPNRFAIDKNPVAAVDRQSGWPLHRHLLRMTRWQVDLHGVQPLHGERCQHERSEQEEHHIDHRNDFDAAALRGTGATKLHGALPPVSEARRIPLRRSFANASSSSISRSRRREK